MQSGGIGLRDVLSVRRNPVTRQLGVDLRAARLGMLERLEDDDASALALDPTRLAYWPLADVEGLSEKAKRDAGSIAVADVG